MTTTIVPTITITRTEGGLQISSLEMAAGAGVEHQATLKLIQAHNERLSEFGRVGFEIRPFETAGGTQKRNLALLNEPQAMLLMTFMKNTPQVADFKVALIKAFIKMRAIIENPAVQEALFEDSFFGIRVGKPVTNLPLMPLIGRGQPFNPRTARNNKIAEVAKEAKGSWVPVFIDKMTTPQLKELASAIRSGRRHSFPRGDFNAALRNNTLYIRHTAKEITA